MTENEYAPADPALPPARTECYRPCRERRGMGAGMNTTALALMCIGLAPIPPTPFSRVEALSPEPIRTLDPDSSRKRAHVRRMEVVVELLRERGPLSRAQVAKELRKSHETALNWLCELREMGRVTAKRVGRYWIYEVAQ